MSHLLFQPIAVPRLLLVTVLLALAFAAGNVLTAFGGPTGTTFYGCLRENTGDLYAVSTTAAPDCRKDSLISWTSYSGADLDVAYLNASAGEVKNNHLDTNSVTSDKILDGSIQLGDIAAGALDGSYVNEGQVNSVTSAMLGSSLQSQIRCNAYPRAHMNLSGCDLRTVDFRGLLLSGINLSGADLWNAKLDGALLHSADLSNARLEHTILNGANLWFANLEGARHLSAANLEGAAFLSTTCPDGTNSDADPNRTCIGHLTP